MNKKNKTSFLQEVKIDESTVVSEVMENSELSDTVCSTAERTLCENRTLNINMASTPIFPNITKVVPMQNVPNIGAAKPLVSVIYTPASTIIYEYF